MKRSAKIIVGCLLLVLLVVSGCIAIPGIDRHHEKVIQVWNQPAPTNSPSK